MNVANDPDDAKPVGQFEIRLNALPLDLVFEIALRKRKVDDGHAFAGLRILFLKSRPAIWDMPKTAKNPGVTGRYCTYRVFPSGSFKGTLNGKPIGRLVDAATCSVPGISCRRGMRCCMNDCQAAASGYRAGSGFTVKVSTAPGFKPRSTFESRAMDPESARATINNVLARQTCAINRARPTKREPRLQPA